MKMDNLPENYKLLFKSQLKCIELNNIAEIKNSIERVNNWLNTNKDKSTGGEWKSVENIQTKSWRTKRRENTKS